MPVFLLPNFILDLQEHSDAHFARRVLLKTLQPDGSFRPDTDDHRYKGIDDAWIRYVSTHKTAYRVIYLRRGSNIYLYRAGEHSIEEKLSKPTSGALEAAIPVMEAEARVSPSVTAITTQEALAPIAPPLNRLKRNVPTPQIYREIFSRRNLPHRDIWLVSPFVNTELFAPTKAFGKLLLDQVEDGARVVMITSLPKDKEIDWMEKLAERKVDFYIYPRLHSKLYCFVFDEHRRNECGLRNGDKYSSLVLIGSANLTSAGISPDSDHCNEELCYSVPENEIEYIQDYITELMIHGYELPDVRRFKARGQWQLMEEKKW